MDQNTRDKKPRPQSDIPPTDQADDAVRGERKTNISKQFQSALTAVKLAMKKLATPKP